MAGYETLDVAKYIDTLRTDVQLQAMFPNNVVIMSKDLAGREAPSYYIVFTMTDAHDTNTLDGNRAFTSPSYQIEAIGREVGYDVLRPIIERIEAIVTERTDPPRQIGNTYVGRFIRTNILDWTQVIDNVRWHRLGGIYTTVAFTYVQP